jgi:hypothetical protein
MEAGTPMSLQSCVPCSVLTMKGKGDSLVAGPSGEAKLW